jgi:hypothetical protein
MTKLDKTQGVERETQISITSPSYSLYSTWREA